MSDIVLITGISGSGKSQAMHALEDAGYYCIDNLPPELLRELLRLEAGREKRRMALSIDVRSTGSAPGISRLLDELSSEVPPLRTVFLEASTEALVRRFSETRRPHPLSGGETQRSLVDAIDMERRLLADLRERSTVIDTSALRPAQLRQWVRDLVQAPQARLTLVFQSFAYRHGVPPDADFVFDMRVLPNPHYERGLRDLSGKDEAVATFLQAQPEARDMLQHIIGFIERWLPSFQADPRSHLTVAVGCTGGQHRSVYLVEALSRHFKAWGPTLVRHRELDGR